MEGKEILLVLRDGKLLKFPRGSFEDAFGGRTGSEEVGEAKMQKMIEDNPELIPYEKLGASHLLLIGRESLAPDSGAIDHLFTDENGIITICECKLGKNPEKRRRVVAQVMEYASALWGMSYEKFEEKVVKPKLGGSLANAMENFLGENKPEDWDREEFRKNVEACLEKGDFRLLVVVEDAPMQLKRLVSFIREKSAIDINCVELKYFQSQEDKEIQIIAPYLFESAVKELASRALTEVQQWDEESFFKAVEEGGNETRTARLRTLLNLARQEDVLYFPKRKNPLFQFKSKLGLQPRVLLSCYGSGILYPYMHYDRFETEDDLRRFVGQLNSFEIFDFTEADVGRDRGAKGPVEDMTDENFKKLIELVRQAIHGRIEPPSEGMNSR